MHVVKSPFILRWIYPTLVWRKRNKPDSIYITFDDGPIPVVTPAVLKILKKFNAKATFFCIGDNIRKHPDVFSEVVSGGHSIGNHTFNHLRGWDTPDAEYIDNFKQCDQLVRSNLFRPPYGRIKKSQIAALHRIRPDLKIIMWDVLSADYDPNLSPEQCLKNVLTHTEPGSIVVFHDSLKAFERLEYALPLALQAWSDKGYSFRSL